MKGFLSREGYSFEDRNVEEDDRAYEELIALGWRVVPLTLIEGRAVKGYDEEKLRAALTEASRTPPAS